MEHQAICDRVREIFCDERFQDKRHPQRAGLLKELHNLEKVLADAGFDGACDPRLVESESPEPRFGTFS